MIDIEKCRKVIQDACNGKWKMCVPPDVNNDSDLVLSAAIDELEKYQCEAKKIMITCSKPCHMGKDIKLIEREYELGHKPYGEILAQYEQQIKDCPKICPRYKAV